MYLEGENEIGRETLAFCDKVFVLWQFLHSTTMSKFELLFSAELKLRGNYLGHFWQADLGFIGQAIIGVKVPTGKSSHVTSI